MIQKQEVTKVRFKIILTLLLLLNAAILLKVSSKINRENDRLAAIGVAVVVMRAAALLDYDTISKYCLTHPLPDYIPSKAELEKEAARRGISFSDARMKVKNTFFLKYEYVNCEKVKDKYVVTVQIIYTTRGYTFSTPISVFVKKMPNGSFRVIKTHDPCAAFGFD